MKSFSPKSPDDIVTLGFDFSDFLDAGEIVISATFTVTVLKGIDANPSAMKSGSPFIAGNIARHNIQGGVTGVTYLVKASVITSTGQHVSKSGVLVVESVGQFSALFVREIAIAYLRDNNLASIGSTYGQIGDATDAALWLKLTAAEAELSRRLGVLLGPTEIFTDEPSPAEISALEGRPYLVEPGYSMTPNYFSVQNWGSLKLRQKPVIEVKEFALVYPNQGGVTFNVPLAWIRVDKKYGQLIVSPSAQAVTSQLSVFAMQALTSGSNVPYMIRVHYVAGLTDADTVYTDVVSLVYRMATLSLLKDAIMPGSMSISADGLSESLSSDISKLNDAVDADIYALKETLNGPIWAVL